MSDKTNSERIDILEKRVSDLTEQVANASSPSLFIKALITLFLVGTFFFIWKIRNVIKWSFVGILIWFILGDTISNICASTGNFISSTWSEICAENKVQDNHERELERIQAEANARIQVIQAEDAVKQSEWERGQATQRNEAINTAISNGHWNNTVETPPVVTQVKDGNTIRYSIRF